MAGIGRNWPELAGTKSIPALTGETITSMQKQGTLSVHPRDCEENSKQEVKIFRATALARQ